nr:SPOC domain-containing protein 1 isoform X2 [Zootoca vivipara]
MKSIATKLTKPCYVLLKDTNQQRKKQKHCLMHPNPKKLPQKMQNKRKDGIYEKLKVALFDLLDKNCTEKLKTSSKIKNAEGQLEYEKVNKVESGLELNTSVQVLSSGESDPGETNNDFDIKAERDTEISAICDEGIFARFSSKESCHDNSIIHHCHEEEIEKEKECLDTSPIHEMQKLKIKFLEPTEMFMKYENKLVKKAKRKCTCHKIEEYQDLDKSPSFLGEMSGSDTSQNLIATFHKEALQTHKIYSSFSSENSFSETKVSKISRIMGASSLLPDTTVEKEDICQANSEFEPNFVSEANLKIDLKDTISDITKSEMSIGERIVSDSMDASAEEFLKGQVGMEEHETLNPNNTLSGNKNMDSCWFLLKIDEVIDQEDSVCATDEENKFRDLECGDVILDHSLDFLELESKSGYQSFTDGTAVTKLSEKRRMSSDHQEDFDGEINNVEESVNTQPAEENTHVQEEESLRPHQSHGVKMVFYEYSGSTVKLLGTQTRSDEMFTLGKLIELEDSSDDEHKESQGNCALLLPNSKNEGKLYSETVVQHRPLNLDDSRTKKNKRRQGPNKAPAPVHSSQLTQEQSRRKVMDALREALLKRLDDLPDLCVQKNTVLKIAKKVEQEIFKRFCCVEQNYKNKYRSLLFNLKSAENQYLCRKLILGEITPKRLVQMSSLEMAPPELAEWRAKENKRVLEIIEKEEQEAPRCCSAKFNHKGIVEIEREAEEDLMFQEIFGSQSPKEVNHSSEVPGVSVRDPDDVQWNHSEDPNYLSCFGQITAGGVRGFKPPTYKHTLKEKADATKHWHPSTMYSEEGERPLHADSPISPHIPKKHRRVEKQSTNSSIWEGVIHMFSVKQFVAKAYPVSGSSCNLSQEMGVIRFHPSLPEGFDPYNTLYSYLNNKQRYGILDSNQMEIFMVPLAAYQPVPSKLHAFGGPGLEPCHPSLLLGLILPKRTCTGSLETMSNPLPKAMRKNITLKDNIEADCFSLPQVDTCQTWPPPQLSIDSLLCGNEGPLLVLPRQEPLAADAVFVHPEGLGGETFHRDPSSLRHEEAGNEANHFPVGDALQSLSSSPWAVEQWSNLSLGILGAQPHQDRDHVQLCGDSDESHIWKTIELLLSSNPVCPDQHEAEGANLLDSPFLQSILCADAVPPCEVSQVLSSPQIPCIAYVAGEPNSLLQETLSLIQHVESQLQTQEPNTQMP